MTRNSAAAAWEKKLADINPDADEQAAAEGVTAILFLLGESARKVAAMQFEKAKGGAFEALKARKFER